jgi:hypothetical protein
MKAYVGVDYSFTILDLGTRSRWVVILKPLMVYTRKRIPATHLIGGWMCPRARLDAVEKNRTPAVQSLARRYADWAVLEINSPLVLASLLITYSGSICLWMTAITQVKGLGQVWAGV